MRQKKSNPQKPKIKKFEIKFHFNLKKLFIWLLIGFLVGSFLISLVSPLPEEEISLSQVLTDIREEKIDKVLIAGETLEIVYKDESRKISRKEPSQNFTEILKDAGIEQEKVNFEVKSELASKFWGRAFDVLLYFVLPVAFFIFIFRQARGAQDSIFSFGRSRAKLFVKGKQSVTFNDVGGVEEAKKELEEIVDFLKNPKKYLQMGARTPKGVLLIGPSGTGKTLLAKAIAGEANVPFFSMAGSEFMEMLVGVGASRTRDLFSTAKKAAPSIIFIDELDAIGQMRGLGYTSGAHGEQEQTLNQILTEMDGFTPNDNVVVLAATNRPDYLDPALVRPGRFDRRVVLNLPDIEERKKILEIHKIGKPFNKGVSWDKVAKRTVGFSGADLENMLNEAAILAAREGEKTISSDDIEEAATKVKLGPQKKRLQSKEEREMTAYHEAGHAVAASNLKTMDPVHRISIVSRGLALGFTLIPPEKDKYHETKTELEEKIVALLGGRAAEEIRFSEFTGGAASDIEEATGIARRMVVQYGMSDLGPLHLGPQIDKAEWGGAFIKPSELSDEMQAKVDKEIKKIVDKSYEKAREILSKNRKKLDKVVKRLLEKETIDGEEFKALMASKPQPRGE